MKTISFLLLSILLCACGQSSSHSATTTADSAVQANAAPPAYDKTLPLGKVTDSILCKSGQGQYYAVYLPSYYTPDKAFPCIYFFDAHARGALPLKMYAALAEHYGFILVGSNASKNGTPWPVTQGIVQDLMSDADARMHIDLKRIYTAGFSGGSRVASTVAIRMGGIAGVVGCSAGFPQLQEPLSTKFDYFGMVGEYDFNMLEMEELDDALAQNSFTHQLLTSGGIHDWPPAFDFNTALLWLQLSAIKEKTQQDNGVILQALKRDFDKRIEAARAAGELVKEHQLLAGAARALDGFTDVTAYKKQDEALLAGDKYKAAAALHSRLQGEERQQQAQLMQQFGTQDEASLKQEIETLKHDAAHAATVPEKQMNSRLVSYLGLVGYLASSHALKDHDLEHVAIYLHAFKMADPENPDCDYLTAIYYAEKGDSKGTLASLNAAAKLGYAEVATLMSEQAFAPIRSNVDFIAVVGQIKKNASSVKEH